MVMVMVMGGWVQDTRWHHRATAERRSDEAGRDVVDFVTGDGKVVMSVGEGVFDFHGTHDWFFGFSNGQMARKYNKELPNKDPLNTSALHEPAIFFPPLSPSLLLLLLSFLTHSPLQPPPGPATPGTRRRRRTCSSGGRVPPGPTASSSTPRPGT